MTGLEELEGFDLLWEILFQWAVRAWPYAAVIAAAIIIFVRIMCWCHPKWHW